MHACMHALVLLFPGLDEFFYKDLIGKCLFWNMLRKRVFNKMVHFLQLICLLQTLGMASGGTDNPSHSGGNSLEQPLSLTDVVVDNEQQFVDIRQFHRTGRIRRRNFEEFIDLHPVRLSELNVKLR